MTATISEPAKFKLPSLNGLRALSIFFVIFSHLHMHNNIFDAVYRYKIKALYPVINFITDGQLGVNIFFVISGFLITTLLLKEELKTQTISLKGFYLRRTLRIFPAYYFYLLVLLVLQLLNILHIEGESWLTAITYTKYFNRELDWHTSHAWSLSIEEHFYLFWPLVFTLGDKARKRTAFFLVIIVPFIRLYVYDHPITWMDNLTIFQRIDAIALGCLVALYKDELLNLLNRNFLALFYFSLAGILLLRHISAKLIQLNFEYIVVPFGSSFGTLSNLFVGVILLYSVYGRQGLWFRLLNTKILNYIGLLSYGLYLWQQMFTSADDFWITAFPQNVVLIFLMAMFSYYCIEQPFLKLKDKFQKTRIDHAPAP